MTEMAELKGVDPSFSLNPRHIPGSFLHLDPKRIPLVRSPVMGLIWQLYRAFTNRALRTKLYSRRLSQPRPVGLAIRGTVRVVVMDGSLTLLA